MKKFLNLIILSVFAFGLNLPDGTNQFDSNVWAAGRAENIKGYEGGAGEIFTYLQGNDYFAYAVAIGVGALLLGLGLHFLAIGRKHFSHDGKKIYTFSLIERVSHWVAALSWVVLVPTGIIMMWGAALGGGAFVRFAKNAHGLATILFAISVLPMLFAWFRRMLPSLYDAKWMMIMGGYLSKSKACIPAGKFNAGQKMWYWVAIPGGLVMIATGAAMFFLDFKAVPVATWLGISQIDLLRISAIVHSTLGVACAIFFVIHIYMTAVAIRGAIWAMVTGYKEEEEVYVLHHYWYQELKRDKKIEPSEYEKVYEPLK